MKAQETSDFNAFQKVGAGGKEERKLKTQQAS